MFELLSPWLAMFLILIGAPFLLFFMLLQNLVSLFKRKLKFSEFIKQSIPSISVTMFFIPLIYSYFLGIQVMPNWSLWVMGGGVVLFFANMAFSKNEN